MKDINACRRFVKRIVGCGSGKQFNISNKVLFILPNFSISRIHNQNMLIEYFLYFLKYCKYFNWFKIHNQDYFFRHMIIIIFLIFPEIYFESIYVYSKKRSKCSKKVKCVKYVPNNICTHV